MTLEDILEEIVGDIDDEEDEVRRGIQREAGGSFIIDGEISLRDLNRNLSWRLPDDRASTLAGFVLYESRQIPEVGQVLSFQGFQFEILGRDRLRITRLRVTPESVLAQRRRNQRKTSEQTTRNERSQYPTPTAGLTNRRSAQAFARKTLRYSRL